MKKRILAFALVVLTVVAVLAGCSKLYDYDNYEQYIRLGQIDGIEINQSDINDGILNAFHGLYDVENDKLTETTYNKETDDVFVQKGDTVNIDYTGKKDGVAFSGGTATGYDLVIGSNSFIDGFEDGLVGYKIGDKPNLNLTFPEDYGNAELKGAAVVFEVKINSIKRVAYPEFNDENVKSKTNWESKEQFVEDAKKTVMNNLIWQKIYSSSKIVSYPKSELEKYYEQSIDTVESQATMFGMTLSSYVKQYYGSSDMKSFYASMAQQAQRQVKQELIILRFIELKPELKMSEEKYNEEVEKLYNEYKSEQNFTGSLKKFKKQYDRKALEITIYYDIVIDYLREHCVEKDDITKNGFIPDRNGVRYYVDNEFLKGWQTLDGKEYYFDDTGYAPVNRNMTLAKDGVDGERHYEFGENGLLKGLFEGKEDSDKGTRYYKEGVMLKGYQEVDLDGEGEGEKAWYFFDKETGYMVKKDVADIDGNGTYYYFGESGVREENKASGMYMSASLKGLCFFNDGTLLRGWIKVKDNVAENVTGLGSEEGYSYYYSNADGVAVKGVTKIDDLYYEFNEDQTCKGIYTGKVEEETGVKLCKDGMPIIGWAEYNVEGKTTAAVAELGTEEGCEYYYCGADGAAVKETTKIGEIYYGFNAETGVCTGRFSGTFEDKTIVNGEEQPAATPGE